MTRASARLLSFALCPWIFPHSAQTTSDFAENSAWSGSIHCSLSTSWLYALHLSYKCSNANRALNMSWGYSAFVTLFFQVRGKPWERLSRMYLYWHFWHSAFPASLSSLHELKLKLRGQGWWWGQGGRNIRIGRVFVTICICFGLICPLSAMVSRRKLVLSEPTISSYLLLSEGQWQIIFQKSKNPRRRKIPSSLCKHLHNSGISQGFQYCKDSQLLYFSWLLLYYLSNC